MAGQVFAILIGVDKYQAGNIWNLNAAVDDARSFERWLTNDLQVPRDHICTLLDSQATKRNIEQRFLSHFVNNPAIEPGDALIFYYAGHGSSIRAPPGWFDRGHGDVSVLCTYDYDTKLANGKTNAGISDRSMHAMLRDLAQVKGDNITLILDTCFCLPSTNGTDPKERRYTRYTPTRKATREDLLAGLWHSASQKTEPAPNRGFTGASHTSHVVLAASSAWWPATERKDGGNFTRALLALKDARSLHKLTYADLPHELAHFMSDHQHAACAGANADRILFDGVPFASDGRFVAASARDGGHTVHVAAGEMHGVAVGTEFALHAHNRRGSLNGSIGSVVATQVFPTWCLARPKAPVKHAPHHVPRDGWARVTRWSNNRGPAPFRVNVKGSLSSFLRHARIGKKALQTQDIGIVQDSSADDADLSVRLRRKALAAEHRDSVLATDDVKAKEARVSISSEETCTGVEEIESVARFHMRLYRKRPAQSLAGSDNKVSTELCRFDLGREIVVTCSYKGARDSLTTGEAKNATGRLTPRAAEDPKRPHLRLEVETLSAPSPSGTTRTPTSGRVSRTRTHAAPPSPSCTTPAPPRVPFRHSRSIRAF
ncbi:hypothetical protein GSI_01536 [Ganoderma sinense ZZ0214-1]|uniref:Peptidase C14 caspase domain-containing protein n=1 Tax=Ganoderma sinense ZZ0214-1 TaxID=1077348 RepID=A0A2G8SQ30_9APHY|nr:hypothetical protein GSI_01536 [Ganoderma sinense ZZ0214-1]